MSDLNKNIKKDNFAIVYLAAGVSSRFGSKIKQLEKVGPNGEALIEISLDQAIAVGFKKIIFIVGNITAAPFKEKFKNNYKGIPVFYVTQKFSLKTRNKPWGTTDALCLAKDFIDSPFVVCNGDDIYGQKTLKILFNHLRSFNEPATIGYKLSESFSENGPVNRGVFKIKSNRVAKITEMFNISKSNLKEKKLSPARLCGQNAFALNVQIVELLDNKLSEFKQKNSGNRNAECILSVELSKLIEEGKINMHFYVAADKWMGITNPGDEIIIKRNLAKMLK
jgi:choline kinase